MLQYLLIRGLILAIYDKIEEKKSYLIYTHNDDKYSIKLLKKGLACAVAYLTLLVDHTIR